MSRKEVRKLAFPSTFFNWVPISTSKQTFSKISVWMQILNDIILLRSVATIYILGGFYFIYFVGSSYGCGFYFYSVLCSTMITPSSLYIWIFATRFKNLALLEIYTRSSHTLIKYTLSVKDMPITIHSYCYPAMLNPLLSTSVDLRLFLNYPSPSNLSTSCLRGLGKYSMQLSV